MVDVENITVEDIVIAALEDARDELFTQMQGLDEPYSLMFEKALIALQRIIDER